MKVDDDKQEIYFTSLFWRSVKIFCTISSMVFLAQFILSLSMGSIINAVQSTTAVVVAASVLSFCGAVSANFVTYLDL